MSSADPGESEPHGSQQRRWLTRNVTILSGVSLAQDAASELLYPLLPILLTSVLGAPARSSVWSRESPKGPPRP